MLFVRRNVSNKYRVFSLPSDNSWFSDLTIHFILRRIEVFQLKGLRKILKMTTTYVERSNSNAEVFRRANEKIQQETPDGKIPKQIVPFVTSYLNSRMKKLARISKMQNEHPVKHITLAPNTEGNIIPWNPPNRRVGRPRFKWVTETIKDMWNNIRAQPQHTHITHTFCHKKPDQQQHEAIENCLNQAASPAPYLFK